MRVRPQSRMLILLISVFLLWGWNSAMPVIFNLPGIHFKEALGLMILLGIVSFFLHGGSRHSHTKTDPQYKHSMEEGQS